MVFDLQLFGGGKGGGTTVVNQPASAPAATPEEREAQRDTLAYSRKNAPISQSILEAAANSLGMTKTQTGTKKTFNEDTFLKEHPEYYQQTDANLTPEIYYNKLKAKAVKDNTGMTIDDGQYYYDEPTYTWSQPNLYSPDYNKLGSDAQKRTDTLTSQYDNLNNTLQTGMNKANAYADTLTNSLMNDHRYNDLNAEYTPLLQKYQNGEMPDEVKQNRYNYVSDLADKQWGNKLNNLATKGIVDSSVTRGALSDVNQNMSNALAQTYTSDLTALNNMALSNMQGRAGLVGLDQDQQKGILDIMNKQNTQNYNIGGGMLDLGNNMNTQPAQMALAIQQSQLATPSSVFSLANGQQAQTSSPWQTMGNWRMSMASPEQTIVSQNPSSGGLFSGLFSGIGSYYGAACFTGDSKVSTPDGDKKIIDIKVGDIVTTPNGESKVSKIFPAVVQPVLKVTTDKGNLNTTATQRVQIGDDLLRVGNLKPQMVTVVNGEETKITGIKLIGLNWVYDFDVEDPDNLFYVNGFLVDGRTERSCE